jgi:uncharacterized cupin superfamily protein
VARANIFDPDFEPPLDLPGPFAGRGAEIGRQAGSRELGVSLYELRQGEANAPLHLHHGNEEMIVVLSGRPTLRTLDEEPRALEPGEVVACPRGRAGAHRLDNHAEETARVLIFSTMNAPEVVEYPDSGKVMARSKLGRGGDDPDFLRKIFRADSDVDYFDGEA